jgi:hypothetical protein
MILWNFPDTPASSTHQSRIEDIQLRESENDQDSVFLSCVTALCTEPHSDENELFCNFCVLASHTDHRPHRP